MASAARGIPGRPDCGHLSVCVFSRGSQASPFCNFLRFSEKGTMPGGTRPNPRRSSPSSAKTTSWMDPTFALEKYRSEARSFLEKQSSPTRTLVTPLRVLCCSSSLEEHDSMVFQGTVLSSSQKVMHAHGRNMEKQAGEWKPLMIPKLRQLTVLHSHIFPACGFVCA